MLSNILTAAICSNSRKCRNVGHFGRIWVSPDPSRTLRAHGPECTGWGWGGQAAAEEAACAERGPNGAGGRDGRPGPRRRLSPCLWRRRRGPNPTRHVPVPAAPSATRRSVLAILDLHNGISKFANWTVLFACQNLALA